MQRECVFQFNLVEGIPLMKSVVCSRGASLDPRKSASPLFGWLECLSGGRTKEMLWLPLGECLLDRWVGLLLLLVDVSPELSWL